MKDDFVLQTIGLTKEFAGFTAVKDVNLKVRRNTIHALIGPNGAGKTTCFNLLTKFLLPTKGRILLDGEDVTHVRASRIAQKGMVRSFQISAVFAYLTVLENVRCAIQRRAGGTMAFWKSERTLDVFNEEAMSLLEDVGLADARDSLAVELPYGRKRALEIATTLALEPPVILLDEPTAGMTHDDVDRIVALIRRISRNRTIMMVEHNLGVVSALSDTITVLQRGQVLTEGTYAQVSANPQVVEAYLGCDHG